MSSTGKKFSLGDRGDREKEQERPRESCCGAYCLLLNGSVTGC